MKALSEAIFRAIRMARPLPADQTPQRADAMSIHDRSTLSGRGHAAVPMQHEKLPTQASYYDVGKAVRIISCHQPDLTGQKRVVGVSRDQSDRPRRGWRTYHENHGQS
jgi:hypothetical protein